jgi:uncharacterized protein YdeI (YjbR/CyaY-like superfamily)
MKPKFFATPADFRRWLETNHASETELWVGFYRKSTGRPSITWPEVVDEALCFGWIDGVRKTLDAESYVNRLTPRRPRSNWSAINTRRAKELIKTGRMRPAGLKAFNARLPARAGAYSYEQRHEANLTPEAERKFKSNKRAWKFFESQPPGYRRIAIWYVVSAKQEATQERRLLRLINDSAAGRRIGLLQRPEKK